MVRALTIALTLGSCALASAQSAAPVSHRDKLYDVAVHGGSVFVVGYPGMLLRADVSGESGFERVDLGTTEALFGIDFAADGRGAIVGRSGTVMLTSDGGKSWTRADSGTEEHLFDVAVRPGGKIWAVGHFGTIVHSPDGGKIFAAQHYDATLPPPGPAQGEGAEDTEAAPTGGSGISTAELENEGAAEEARLNAVAFQDDQLGFIVGEFGLVLRTHDGGATWKRQRGASGKLLFDVMVLGDGHVLAVGAEGAMEETRDAGLHWSVVETGVVEHLLCLSVFGRGAGARLVAVGRDGVLVQRPAKGGTVERVHTGVYTWLHGAAFVDEGHGYLVGGRGHLMRVGDGGKRFERLAGR